MADRSRRRGTTLMELMVALTIAGVVLIGVHLSASQLGESARQLVLGASALDADANGERLLRTLVAQARIPSRGSARFDGDERSVRFSTLCTVPAGWQEPCGVTLVIDTLDSSACLSATLSTNERIVLRSYCSRGHFAYLESADAGGRWFRTWRDAVTPPLALGLVLETDTLLVRLGGQD